MPKGTPRRETPVSNIVADLARSKKHPLNRICWEFATTSSDPRLMLAIVELRERVVIPAPCACLACGGRLAKLGEDITEDTRNHSAPMEGDPDGAGEIHLPVLRENHSAPAPFHAISRARAGARLLAMILYAKFGQHQPLNRQSDSHRNHQAPPRNERPRPCRRCSHRTGSRDLWREEGGVGDLHAGSLARNSGEKRVALELGCGR
jgi:transposase